MKYCDRDGRRFEAENGQDKLLRKLYHTEWGKLLLEILTMPFISKIGGWALNNGLSTCFIPSFVKKNHIDLSLYEDKTYLSYNDFFTRKIKPEHRPVNMAPNVLISPCDGKVSVYPIDEKSRFIIKNSEYTVASLTRSEKLSEKYMGGWCVLIRLTVDDYHRYCYVDSGKKSRNIEIPGFYHTVNPTAVECAPVYKENTREYSLIRSERFGDILQMEVGAMMVGRITNHHGKTTAVRGQEKGYFEFGGSTVILLIEDQRVRMDGDLCENTEEGYETIVKMGEKIGSAIN